MKKIVIRLLAAVTLFSISAHPVLAAAKPREMKVGVAVSPSFKAIPGWKETFKRRLAYASQIFERQAGIKFKDAVYWDWQPKTENQDSAYLLEDLRHSFPLHGVDLIIGLSRLPELPSLDQVKDLHVIGRARPFSGYVVLRYPNDPLFRVQEETVLAHELGHLFGAIHTDFQDSIMAPVVDKQIPNSFDGVNQEILKQTRSINFKTGIYALSQQDSQRLISAYAQLMRHQQPLEFYYFLGVMYLNLGQAEHALSVWEKAAEMTENNPIIFFDLGMLYSKMGHHQKAIRELSKAVSQLNLPWQRSQKAQALNAMGEAYMKTGNPSGAYNSFVRAQALEPENVDVLTNLAVLKLKQGQHRTAISELKTLLVRHPQNPKILSNLGNAYYEIGEDEEAVKALKMALRVLSQRGDTEKYAGVLYEIYNHLGTVYLRMKDTNQAVQNFQAACRLFNTVDCHEQLGKIYFQVGKYEEAAQELLGVLQYRKEDATLYGILGVIFSQMGELERALSVFQEGLRYVENTTEAARLHANAGHIYLQVERPDLAEKEFQFAIAKDWKNADAHLGLAMAQLKRTNFLGAKRSLENTLRLNPQHAQARKLLADVQATMEAGGTQTIQFRPRQHDGG